LTFGHAGGSPPARECIVIATSPIEPHPAAPLPPREAGWLAWQALDQSDDIVLLLESDAFARTAGAVVISANGAFLRASGFSDEQVVGRHTSELFPVANHAEVLVNAIRDRGSLRAELACARMEGGTFMLGLHLMPAPGRTPDRCCFVVLGRDITAVLEARQMQNSVQRVLAKVFMSVDEAVAIISAAGVILMTNSRIDQLLGHKPNGLVGRRSIDLVLPEARAETGETIKRQMEHGTDQYYVAPLLRADGTQVVTSITSVLVTTEDSKQFRILTLREQAENGPPIRTESAGRIKLVGLD
jgi:PAS domain S-box-containing protein